MSRSESLDKKTSLIEKCKSVAQMEELDFSDSGILLDSLIRKINYK